MVMGIKEFLSGFVIYVNLNAGNGETSGSWLLFLHIAEKLDAVQCPAHQVQCLLMMMLASVLKGGGEEDQELMANGSEEESIHGSYQAMTWHLHFVGRRDMIM